MLTDILHLFAQNPLKPAYRSPEPLATGAAVGSVGWIDFAGGIRRIGALGRPTLGPDGRLHIEELS